MVMMNQQVREPQGLLIRGESLLREYPNHYQARAHAERYMEIVQMLHKQKEIANWISNNQSYVAWMEADTRPETSHPQQRSDHSGRRGGGHHQSHLQNHDNNSVDDSDSDGDLSRSDDEDYVREMLVEGCGVKEINGVYTKAGKYDGVSKYTKAVRYNGKDEEFSLFRCKLTDNTR